MAEVWRECHTCQRFLSKLHELQREAAMQVPGDASLTAELSQKSVN